MARKITYGVPYTPLFCILFEIKRATDHIWHIFILNTFITLLLKVTLKKFRQIVTRMPTHGLASQLTHNGSLSTPVLPGNQLTTVWRRITAADTNHRCDDKRTDLRPHILHLRAMLRAVKKQSRRRAMSRRYVWLIALTGMRHMPRPAVWTWRKSNEPNLLSQRLCRTLAADSIQ